MRLPLSRATALVAIITALVTASGFAPARMGPGGRERDRVLRVTRAGPQRPESPDGPIHCHEETDAVYVPGADVIGAAGHADAPPGPAADHSAAQAVLASTLLAPTPHFPAYVPPEPRRPIATRGGLELHAPDR